MVWNWRLGFCLALLAASSALSAGPSIPHGRYACIAPNDFDNCDDCAMDYAFVVDRNFSMNMGAENFTSLHRLYTSSDHLNWEPDLLRSRDSLGFLSRVVRACAWEYPLASLVMVTQHEVFGHGFRARDKGLDPDYFIDVPFPYGDGGGWTAISILDFLTLTPHEVAAWRSGGVESTELLARELGLKALMEGVLDFREAILYLITYHDQTDYILSIDAYYSSHDMVGYMESLNDDIYQRTVLTEDEFKASALINFLDPLTFWSVHAVWSYLWSGEKCQDLPMLKLGCYRILPSARLTLAPYGLEYGLHSYISYNHHVGEVYARYGDTDGEVSICMGIKAFDVYQWENWRLGGRLDLWWQPEVNGRNPHDPKHHTGGAATVRGSYGLGSCWAATAEVGAKTSGFLMGESLDADFILRLGMTYRQ